MLFPQLSSRHTYFILLKSCSLREHLRPLHCLRNCTIFCSLLLGSAGFLGEWAESVEASGKADVLLGVRQALLRGVEDKRCVLLGLTRRASDWLNFKRTSSIILVIKQITPGALQLQTKNRQMKAQDIPATDSDVESFIVAIKSGNLDAMEEYLNKFGRDISNRLDSQQRQPPLYFAVSLADDETCYQAMKKLIQNGANPNFKDQNEQTVLFYACRDGKSKCVKLLEECGVSLQDEDAYGQIPLYYIANENQLHLLDKYKNPASYNHVDKLASQTPLYYAAKKGYYEMCKQLIERGCDVTHHDSHNKTAVEYARRARYHEVTEYLSAEVKKAKDKHKEQQIKEMQIQAQESAQEQKKKKKESETIPVSTKSIYKIVYINDKGETKDLSEEEVRSLLRNKPVEESYFANPESIPRELLAQASHVERWQKVAARILSSCWKHKGGFWFHEPVDPVKFGIMDYHDIISRPMDLGTIKKRLHYNFYPSHRDFAEDMRLVWGNCYKYNGQEHQISYSAKEIEKLFEQSYRQQITSQLQPDN